MYVASNPSILDPIRKQLHLIVVLPNSTVLKTQYSTVKKRGKIAFHYFKKTTVYSKNKTTMSSLWKYNIFLLLFFFILNLHKTSGAVRFLLMCSYFVPLTCFVLFCQHNNTSEIFNNIKWTDRSPNVQLKFWNCDSLSENQHSPNLSLLHRWWITFTL